MKRKSRGQTLVEFALVFPLIMLFLFATIDFGYYIYAWSQVQFGARRGAEQATLLQPRDVIAGGSYGTVTGDPCLDAIRTEVKRSGGFNVTTTIQNEEIFIDFYPNATSNTPITNNSGKLLGNIVQVRVQQALAPLTPVGASFLRGQPYRFTALSRRTIVSNRPSFAPSEGPDYVNCVYR